MNSLQKRQDTRRFSSLLIWEVPAALKKKFKAACRKQGFSMKEVVISMMERFNNNPPRSHR